MINEVIENVYTKNADYYVDGLAIKSTSGNAYAIHIGGFENISREELKDYSINSQYNVAGLSILKVLFKGDTSFVELSDKRFIELSVCGGFFQSSDEDNGGLCYSVTDEEDYDEYKDILNGSPTSLSVLPTKESQSRSLYTPAESTSLPNLLKVLFVIFLVCLFFWFKEIIFKPH